MAERGGCHCGRIRFEVAGSPDEVWLCNCSICTMKGYWHWMVPKADFELLSGAEHLATYRFGTGQARHHFCSVCGISAFYIARSDPDKIDVNVRCLDGIDLGRFEPRLFDGQNWEEFYEKVYRGRE